MVHKDLIYDIMMVCVLEFFAHKIGICSNMHEIITMQIQERWFKDEISRIM